MSTLGKRGRDLFTVVYCNTTLSGVTSLCRMLSLHTLTSTPPVECAMHFGTPVVPLEYTIRKGSRNATRSKTRSSFPSAACKKVASVCVLPSPSMPAGRPRNRGCVTTPSNSGTTSCMPVTSWLILGRRSIVLPLYTAQSSTKTYFGLICTRRSRMPLAPMSVLLELKSAPKLTVAMKTMNVSKLVDLGIENTGSPHFSVPHIHLDRRS